MSVELSEPTLQSIPLLRVPSACGREGALSRRMIRVADVIHCVRSSLSRLSKHHMVPSDVCDAKQPVIGPSGGPEIDVTVADRAFRSR